MEARKAEDLIRQPLAYISVVQNTNSLICIQKRRTCCEPEQYLSSSGAKTTNF
jgi:hypothetical protein